MGAVFNFDQPWPARHNCTHDRTAVDADHWVESIVTPCGDLAVWDHSFDSIEEATAWLLTLPE